MHSASSKTVIGISDSKVNFILTKTCNYYTVNADA